MDWSKSASHRLRLLARIGFRRWGSVLRIMAWLLIADLALRCLPYRKVESLLATVPKPDANRPSEGEMLALAAEVEAAARYHLYPMQCLRRSLVLRRLLCRRGVATELRFGVRKDEGRIVAHAWLEHEGRSLDPNPPARSYVRLEDEGPRVSQSESS